MFKKTIEETKLGLKRNKSRVVFYTIIGVVSFYPLTRYFLINSPNTNLSPFLFYGAAFIVLCTGLALCLIFQIFVFDKIEKKFDS